MEIRLCNRLLPHLWCVTPCKFFVRKSSEVDVDVCEKGVKTVIVTVAFPLVNGVV